MRTSRLRVTNINRASTQVWCGCWRGLAGNPRHYWLVAIWELKPIVVVGEKIAVICVEANRSQTPPWLGGCQLLCGFAAASRERADVVGNKLRHRSRFATEQTFEVVGMGDFDQAADERIPPFSYRQDFDRT